MVGGHSFECEATLNGMALDRLSYVMNLQASN